MKPSNMPDIAGAFRIRREMRKRKQDTMVKGDEAIFVVHCKREKYDVYVGRGRCPQTGKLSKWGNPFEIGRDGARETVIRKYREWIVTQPQLMAALPELRGKVLGCWCAPKACHGDVLSEMANTRIADTGGANAIKECNDETEADNDGNTGRA